VLFLTGNEDPADPPANVANARRALGHKDLQWIVAHIPREYRDNPKVIRSFLVTAAEGWPEFADSAVYHSAHSALANYGRRATCRTKLRRSVGPKIRAEFGGPALSGPCDPETAYRELISARRLVD
jgi:hypothetical protein